MDQRKIKISEAIASLTTKYINALTENWLEIYQPELAYNNLDKLVDHVDTFYNEVLEETIARRNKILNRIKELQNQQQELKHKLRQNIDSTIPKDMSLFQYQNELIDEVEELKNDINEKMVEINILLQRHQHLCNDLEIDNEERTLCVDPLPTNDEIIDFAEYVDSLANEKNNRFETIDKLKIDIHRLADELEYDFSDEPGDYRLITEIVIKPSNSNIIRLRQCYDALIMKKKQIEKSIYDMKEKLVDLWKCLDESPILQNKFMSLKSCTQTTFNQLAAELSRCQLEKRKHIKRFVDHIRQQILSYWDKTCKSEVERSRFTNFTSDCYTEDLLSLHELELDGLKNFYHSNEKLFEKLTEHKTLFDRMTALDAKENEPGRLNNRGGQLLKEEKERKMIANKLPKIRAQIIDMANAFEDENHRKFLVWGEDIVHVIENDYNNRQMIKDQHMSARKAIKENAGGGVHHLPGVTMSAQKTMIRTPMSAAKNIGTRAQTSIKRIGSSTCLLGTGSNVKKMRLEVPTTSNVTLAKLGTPVAKRNLLGDYNKNAPGTFVKPKQATTNSRKSPLRRVISTMAQTTALLRRSYPRKVSTKTKTTKNPETVPTISITSGDSIINYETFQEQISSSKAKNRSSELPSLLVMTTKPRRSHRRSRRHLKPSSSTTMSIEPSNNVPLASSSLKKPRIQTPSRVHHSTLVKSSTITRGGGGGISSRTPSPSPGKMKLTTKNLPICF